MRLHAIGTVCRPAQSKLTWGFSGAIAQTVTGADVRLPAPAAAEPGHLPEAEGPCFPITEITLRDDTGRFAWALAAADPEDNTATGRCLGAAGINLVMQRVQDAIVTRGCVTTRVLAEPQDLRTGKLEPM